MPKPFTVTITTKVVTAEGLSAKDAEAFNRHGSFWQTGVSLVRARCQRTGPLNRSYAGSHSVVSAEVGIVVTV